MLRQLRDLEPLGEQLLLLHDASEAESQDETPHKHTSHVTRHTSHVTRHTSHVTRHTSPAQRVALHPNGGSGVAGGSREQGLHRGNVEVQGFVLLSVTAGAAAIPQAFCGGGGAAARQRLHAAAAAPPLQRADFVEDFSIVQNTSFTLPFLRG